MKDKTAKTFLLGAVILAISIIAMLIIFSELARLISYC